MVKPIDEITQLREMLAKASQFSFEETGIAISIRLNNRDEGPEVRWVIHKIGKPRRILNKLGRWENQTRNKYLSDDFIERTRMTLEEAFRIASAYRV